MALPEIDVPVVIATSDKKATSQARKVFRHLKVADRPDRVRKLFQKIQSTDGIHVGGSKPNVAAGTFPSVVLLDVDMPEMSVQDLIPTIRAMAPGASMVILASDGKAVLEGIRAGAQGYLMKPIRVTDLATCFRVLEERKGSEVASDFPAVDAALPHLVEKLHDPANGQLDARRVADFFGLNVAEVARLLGRGVSTVHKTPTALTLQENLRPFEAMASGLLRLTGSDARARMWMNASDPALENHAPIEWLRMGNINDLASYIQDLLEGRPA